MSRATTAELAEQVEALTRRVETLEASEERRVTGRYVERVTSGEAQPVPPAPVLDFRESGGGMSDG